MHCGANLVGVTVLLLGYKSDINQVLAGLLIGYRLCRRPLGPKECNLECLDACVIVCLLARWPDLDELEIHFGGLGSLLVLAASLCCHLVLPRVPK